MSRGVRRLGALVLVNLLVILALLALLEGLSSVALLVDDLFLGKSGRLAERLHTRYDPELGWVNIPGRRIPDMYGPGKSVTISAQGFRGSREYPVQVPPGMKRILCTGDSFTFGYGVADEETWCHLLSELDARLETVNLGQGGYGIGQAFLSYQRAAPQLDHDLHLFAFIYDDVERARHRKFMGYGKPVLTVEQGRLVTRNVPVPRVAFLFPNIAAITRLRAVQLAVRLLPREQGLVARSRIAEVVLAILGTLHAGHERRGGTMVAVYLPTYGDYEGHGTDSFRDWLRRNCSRNGWNLVDLTDDLRQLPADRAKALFLPAEAIREFAMAAGHYSAEGNLFVAEALYRRLLAIPDAARALAPEDPFRPASGAALPGAERPVDPRGAPR